jgi:hypothetical protein
VLRLYQDLLRLRQCLHLGWTDRDAFDAIAIDGDTIAMIYRRTPGGPTAVLVRLRGRGRVALDHRSIDMAGPWRKVFTTEDPPYSDGTRIPVTRTESPGVITTDFAGPAALVLRATRRRQ